MPLKQVIENTTSLMIVYEMYKVTAKCFGFVNEDVIEKCLDPVLQDTTYFARGHKFATVDISFGSEEKAKELYNKTLKLDEVGCHTSRVRVEEVPPQVGVAWIMVALCRGRNDKMDILSTSARNWKGTAIEVLVLENLPNRIVIVVRRTF